MPSWMSALARFSPREVARSLGAISHLQRVTSEHGKRQKDIVRELRAISQQLAQIAEHQHAHQKALDALPELTARVRQCMQLTRYDDRNEGRENVARQQLDVAGIALQVNAAVQRATLHRDPFPHLEIPDLIPQGLYDELVAARPPRIFFEHLPVNRQELSVPLEFAPSYCRFVWNTFYRDVIAPVLVPGLLHRFREDLQELAATSWPGLGSFEGAGVRLEILNSRLLLRRPGYEIKPHRDPRWAFMTVLMYFPRPNEEAYGTHVYRLRHEQEAQSGSPYWMDYNECEFVKTVPGRAQSAVAFLNWRGAHAASIPSDAPADTERYLFQIQIGPDAASKKRLLDRLPTEARERWLAKGERRTDLTLSGAH